MTPPLDHSTGHEPPRVVHGIPLESAPEVSVAIIGAGACGLMTALRLREASIDCVVIERDAQPGGSTALSSGLIPAAGTTVQQAAGVIDSVAGFAADIQAKAKGQAAAHLVPVYCEAVREAIDALSVRYRIPFEVLDGFLYPGHQVRRMHSVPERTGAALIARLEAAVRGAGADLLMRAHVTELHVDAGDTLIGVGYRRPDGQIERLRCAAVMLACNGFGGNRHMVADLLPEMSEAVFAGHAGNDGSAIAWGRELDAGIADLGGYQGHGSWAVPHNVLISWALMMAGGIQVNRDGQRFHDETQGYSEAAVHVLAQVESIAWTVFDAPILELARSFPDFRDAEAAGAVRSAPDVAALAALIGCQPAMLGDTLANLMHRRPEPDTRSGRIPLHPAGSAQARSFSRGLEAPWYAIKVTGALFHTQGGLDIDARCRVRRHDGSCLANLWAAGGAARGVSGNSVWGYLSGNGLLSAIGGGWIAGATIAEHLERSRQPEDSQHG